MTPMPRVLIVDDDAAIRAALADLLREEGADVVGEVGDGASGVSAADELLPDVVLMDMRMPGMDGVTATAEIRAAHPEIQVVILSAYDDEVLNRSAADAGAFAYLIKGCAAGVVRETVHEAWRLKQTLESLGGEAGAAAD
jgi:DNA-binding NarL/FixJ family response regulator